MPSQTEPTDTTALVLLAFLAIYLYLRITVAWILGFTNTDIDRQADTRKDPPPG
jgi:hypothetical protein